MLIGVVCKSFDAGRRVPVKRAHRGPVEGRARNRFVGSVCGDDGAADDAKEACDCGGDGGKCDGADFKAERLARAPDEAGPENCRDEGDDCDAGDDAS